MKDWNETQGSNASDLKNGNKVKPDTPRGLAAVQGETQSEWKDHGIIDVSVSDLPDPEGVSSLADFPHHISWEDAKYRTQQLPEVRKEVQKGKTREDFHAMDQKEGLPYKEGKEGAYDLWYGDDPVNLCKADDKYEITGGRHRIFAAKELGLNTIPARVKEKK